MSSFSLVTVVNEVCDRFVILNETCCFYGSILKICRLHSSAECCVRGGYWSNLPRPAHV